MLSTTYSNPPHLKVQKLVDHHVLEKVHYQQDWLILHVMEVRKDCRNDLNNGCGEDAGVLCSTKCCS